MVDKLIYFPNDDKQNYPSCKLDIIGGKQTLQVQNKPIKIHESTQIYKPINEIAFL